METYLADKVSLSPGELVEIGMSDFEFHPIETLRKIYREIDLSGFEEAEPLFRRHLAVGLAAEKRGDVKTAERCRCHRRGSVENGRCRLCTSSCAKEDSWLRPMP